MNRRMFALLGAFVVPLAVLGCTGSSGPPVATVTGAVRYKGLELRTGHVTFMTDKGHMAVTPILDGNYRATNVPQGPVKIAVDTTPPTAVDASDTREPAPAEGVPIPPQYNDPSTSGLALEVKGGVQRFDIELR